MEGEGEGSTAEDVLDQNSKGSNFLAVTTFSVIIEQSAKGRLYRSKVAALAEFCGRQRRRGRFPVGVVVPHKMAAGIIIIMIL